ncbi:hypothetical protein DFH07DRAFT_764759 [Mycena maculata]|uniref:Uncharacterized protein n=1 Tax=Mycena maculata TaxID=230809 RepID=A0AAD7KEV5_9AGAR|nr:hypothetical protein DFH07DRAFT_764759 [Mycena maculata]
MQIDLNIMLQCGLPVWHASAHEKDCANKNSLSFLEGLGCSDGKGVERLWSFLNHCAYHTKDMSIGNRADTIEDKVDSHNFMKNLGSVNILRRKLVVAIAEHAQQVASFKEINKTITVEVQGDWQKAIDVFLKDESAANPYILSSKDGPSEADIRSELKPKEAQDVERRIAPLHGMSATAFLAAGLQLESSQYMRRSMKAEISTMMTADRESKLNEHHMAFMSKLQCFRKLQGHPPPKAEMVHLYLPSELSEAERVNGCQSGIAEMEAQLCEAQCSDALMEICVKLHAKGHLITFKNENITRQKLRTSDLTLDSEEKENDSASRQKLARIGSGKQGQAARNALLKNRTLSWIWTAWGALDMGEEVLHECGTILALPVEWSQAKARKSRWEEDVRLLQEEMCHVLCFLGWQADFWDMLERDIAVRSNVSAATKGGMVVYAAKAGGDMGQLDLSIGATVDSALAERDMNEDDIAGF